jgi:hypothetical protein
MKKLLFCFCGQCKYDNKEMLKLTGKLQVH